VAHHATDASGHDDHGISHVASVKVLLGTFGALIVLTVLTVAATKVNLGANGNLMLAMFIATVKAALVCTYFMHLKYDKPLHTIILLAALLLGLLFVVFGLMDSGQYQQDIIYKNDGLSPTLMHEQLK
jgi:cytochrome c oxidase subunit 4